MVDQIIVSIFDSVDAAYDAARAIKGVKSTRNAKFKIKSGVILTKDDQGKVSLLESHDHPFRGTVVGLVVGGLIGLIGGAPIAAVGALLGATGGVLSSGFTKVFETRFVKSVTTEMRPGKTAVIIEAHEASPKAVDDIVAQGGGQVFRQPA